MRKTIYKSICIIIAITILLTTGLTFLIYYEGFSRNVRESIQNDGYVLQRLMDTCESNTERIATLKSILSDYDRISIIDKNGSVIYDNKADISELDNHKSRSEVKEAAENGFGSSKRISKTTGSRIYYYAYRLNDGSILRVSRAVNDIYYIFKRIVPLMLVIIIIITAFAFYTTKKITKRIMRPINDINIDNPSENEVYDELKPFLKRIKDEAELKAQNEKIRREFSANVSHELKTPLTSITGYAQMINNGMAKKEDILTFTGKIEKEAERLLLLINDIIELSNLDERGIVAEEIIELSAIVQETIMSLESSAQKKNVTIFYGGSDAYIKGSRTMIGELAYNIIDNAIKYNKDGGRVRVFVGKTGDKAEISVKDTGIGIPNEDKDRIFERFYRVDKSHSKTVGGTGLGLSIVKHIAMCHNAEITVKSELNVGTTITVDFDAAEPVNI